MDVTAGRAALRISTPPPTLKTTMALERARQHVLAELRLVAGLGGPDAGPTHLRLCG